MIPVPISYPRDQIQTKASEPFIRVNGHRRAQYRRRDRTVGACFRPVTSPPPPECTDARVLRRVWFPAELAIQRADALACAPAAFRRHGVYLWVHDFGGGVTDSGGVAMGRADLERAFTALGDRLVRRCVAADLFVVGGAAMAMAMARPE